MEEREPWGTLKPSAEAPASNSPASETYVTSLLYRSNIHPLITGHDRGQGQKRRKEEGMKESRGKRNRTSLVVQRLRPHAPTQRAWVPSRPGNKIPRARN